VATVVVTARGDAFPSELGSGQRDACAPRRTRRFEIQDPSANGGGAGSGWTGRTDIARRKLSQAIARQGRRSSDGQDDSDEEQANAARHIVTSTCAAVVRRQQ
jgi:hypothetical protein